MTNYMICYTPEQIFEFMEFLQEEKKSKRKEYMRQYMSRKTNCKTCNKELSYSSLYKHNCKEVKQK